jgi:hypothetical protein
MDNDVRDSQLLSDSAGVLPSGSAESNQGVISGIMAARRRDLGDSGGHALICDGQKPCSNLKYRSACSTPNKRLPCRLPT